MFGLRYPFLLLNGLQIAFVCVNSVIWMEAPVDRQVLATEVPAPLLNLESSSLLICAMQANKVVPSQLFCFESSMCMVADTVPNATFSFNSQDLVACMTNQEDLVA